MLEVKVENDNYLSTNVSMFLKQPYCQLIIQDRESQCIAMVQPSVQHGGHSGPLLGIQLCLPLRTSMVLSADLSLCHEEHV